MRKRKPKQFPVALTIAGSDSGAGAGIQADLKTFAALGVHGVTAITCITAQNPAGVSNIEACTPAIVRQQIESVFDGFKPISAKTGMLYTEDIIRVVAKSLRGRQISLVVDPVMISTSGARLLRPTALKSLMVHLFPLATLLTPNIPEAEALLGRKMRSLDEMITSGQELYRRFGCAVFLKGGHLPGTKEATDVFVDGKQELLFRAPFIRGVRTHGTGCTFSAAVTALLARGFSLAESVARGKKYVSRAIACTRKVAGQDLLNWQQE
jgi:hydroxymethylpyrimidine/phosphomethylpyrimidine kinase